MEINDQNGLPSAIKGLTHTRSRKKGKNEKGMWADLIQFISHHRLWANIQLMSITKKLEKEIHNLKPECSHYAMLR